MKVLVTGGLGYIGSHTVIELISREHELLIVDNLENSSLDVLESIHEYTGVRPEFEEIDIRDYPRLNASVANFQPHSIVHFAAKKDPQESIENPVSYYDANVAGSINLLKSANEYSVRKFVFSSSAAVYGHAQQTPIAEDHPICPLSPYARTKRMVESAIADVFSGWEGSGAFLLRYFNPVGTHRSGVMIPHHQKRSRNLFPALVRAAQPGSEVLTVHGESLPTFDGTGVRDYVHVQDLAAAHAAALDRLETVSGVEVLNVGTGQGYSVRQVIKAFEDTVGLSVRHEYGPARCGDPAISFADTRKSIARLHWKPKFDLVEMVKDEWRARCGADSDRSGS